MTFRLAEVGVVRIADGLHIIKSMPEWAEYDAWRVAGGVPGPMPVVVEPLEIRQDRAWSAIKEKREQVKHGGVLVAGKWFHSDEQSRVQQLGLVLMGASVPAVQWKTLDGSFVTMTPAIASGIFAATAALDMGAFTAAETHRAAMMAAGDPTAYDYSAGWPAIYGG